MRKILEVDYDNAFMRVQPGVINLEVSSIGTARLGTTRRTRPRRASAPSAGKRGRELGRRALPQVPGFTVNHTLGVRVVALRRERVDSRRRRRRCGQRIRYRRAWGWGKRGRLLGIVTEVVLRILRKPEATRTLLRHLPLHHRGGNAVSAIIASGIVPAAIEMMDTLAIVAAKSGHRSGLA